SGSNSPTKPTGTVRERNKLTKLRPQKSSAAMTQQQQQQQRMSQQQLQNQRSSTALKSATPNPSMLSNALANPSSSSSYPLPFAANSSLNQPGNRHSHGSFLDYSYGASASHTNLALPPPPTIPDADQQRPTTADGAMVLASRDPG